MQFSIMITELSTISPKSIAPRLIRLALIAVAAIMLEANIIDSGIANATITPARKLPSRKNSTTTTSVPPSSRFFSDRVQRAVDQSGSIIDHLDLDSRGQVSLDLRKSFLGCFDDRSRIGTQLHHHHAGHDFATSVPRDGALSCQAGQSSRRPNREQERESHSPGCRPRPVRYPRSVFSRAWPRTNRCSPWWTMYPPPALMLVRSNASMTSVDRQSIVGESVGNNLHFKTLVVAAHRVDFGYTLGFTQARRDVPFQNRSQLHRRIALASHLELQDLAQGGGERADLRIAMIADARLGFGESFLDQIPGVVDVCSFSEHDGDDGKPQLGDAADFFRVRQSSHRRLDGVRDVLLDLQRRERSRLRDDLHLDIGHVGYGVDGNRQRVVDAETRDQAQPER